MSTPTAQAESLLEALGAGTVPHPGGTLLAHLRRVLRRACDRKVTYPTLADQGTEVRDRFTGRSHTSDTRRRRDFAGLTAADELDLTDHDPAFRERYGADLFALFRRFRPLLSRAAWKDCLTLDFTGQSRHIRISDTSSRLVDGAGGSGNHDH